MNTPSSHIYLDSQATTSVDPQVLETMLPWFHEKFGNAASRSHSFGWEADKAVESARATLAAGIGAKSREILFTSGATESDNLAILGVAKMYASKGKHLITCVTEHKAVLDPMQALENDGWKITCLEVDENGCLSLDDLKNAIQENTVLVSIMHGNNEVGTVHPIAEIGAICREAGVLFHCDATQTFGKMPLDVEAMNIDLLSASAHKIYGPKGVGLLYVRRRNPRVRLTPIMHGGGHERGFRSGTLNVPGIVGLAKAFEVSQEGGAAEQDRIKELRNLLETKLFDALESVYLNGHPENRLDCCLNISFGFVEGESLIMGMPDIAVSSGSACTSASLEPSYVLRAMGVGDDLAHSSLRFGIGRWTTKEEIETVAETVIHAVNRLRDMSPLWEMDQEGIDLSTVQWAGH
jgi:cysteine desulfurase